MDGLDAEISSAEPIALPLGGSTDSDDEIDNSGDGGVDDLEDTDRDKRSNNDLEGIRSPHGGDNANTADVSNSPCDADSGVGLDDDGRLEHQDDAECDESVGNEGETVVDLSGEERQLGGNMMIADISDKVQQHSVPLGSRIGGTRAHEPAMFMKPLGEECATSEMYTVAKGSTSRSNEELSADRHIKCFTYLSEHLSVLGDFIPPAVADCLMVAQLPMSLSQDAHEPGRVENSAQSPGLVHCQLLDYQLNGVC